MSVSKVLFICFLGFISCKSNKEVSNPTVDDKTSLVVFLDSTNASDAIISDDIDGFYDQLTAVEISILMKNTSVHPTREKAIAAYKPYLRTQVSNWSTKEKIAMLDVFQKVKKLCDTISPRIFPAGMRLIKIKTGSYGNDVYYTRGNDILIPENIFTDFDGNAQLPVMIHEVFHVLSRYNSALKADMYGMIGFTKASKPVKLNPSLEKILLSNPDGIGYQYTIDLESNGEVIKAIPLITSKFSAFKSDMPKFFDYLNFDLYGLEDKGDHYMAQSTVSGKTLIPLNNTPSFFTKIKDNTQYIIHPDEIMADNFMLALQAFSSGEYGKFSKNGKILIDQVIERLSQM